VRAEVSDLGLVTGSFRYRAYGETAQSSGLGPSVLGYAGQLTDPSGLLYMRARWYDPMTGRFVTRDPVMGNHDRPISLNAYMYAHANPVLNTDPTGKCIPVCLGIAAAVLFGVELGFTGADAIFTAQDVLDPALSTAEKAAAVGFFVAGVIGPGGLYKSGADVVRAVNRLPSSARLTENFDDVAGRLERYHGIDRQVARERIHEIKASQGIPADANVVMDLTGNVFHPISGEWLASITSGGKIAR
jgi:RHS repeat-associated protein